MKRLPKTVLAYTAGLLDGEGCIFVNRSVYARVPQLGPYYNLRIAVCMTDRIAIAFLQRHFGGTLTKKARRKNYRQEWVWELATTAAAPFLRALLPYLQVKRKQARVALRFRATVGPRGTGYRRTPATIRRQDAFYRELKRLKHA